MYEQNLTIKIIVNFIEYLLSLTSFLISINFSRFNSAQLFTLRFQFTQFWPTLAGLLLSLMNTLVSNLTVVYQVSFLFISVNRFPFFSIDILQLCQMDKTQYALLEIRIDNPKRQYHPVKSFLEYLI